MQWKGRPLRQYPLPAGEWQFSQRFGEVRAAKVWGMTPSQFDAAPEQDKAEMVAYAVVEGLMQAIEADTQKRDIERARRGKQN